MKSTDQFKKTIQSYLENKANTDKLFKAKFENKDKNIEDCITYILNTVKNSGCNGFTDAEIYGIAIHYYDEEAIDIGAEIKSQVIVNHRVELTEQEKKELKEKAMREFIDENKKKLGKTKQGKKKAEVVESPTLF